MSEKLTKLYINEIFFLNFLYNQYRDFKILLSSTQIFIVLEITLFLKIVFDRSI
jgi:hypothetical protein